MAKDPIIGFGVGKLKDLANIASKLEQTLSRAEAATKKFGGSVDSSFSSLESKASGAQQSMSGLEASIDRVSSALEKLAGKQDKTTKSVDKAEKSYSKASKTLGKMFSVAKMGSGILDSLGKKFIGLGGSIIGLGINTLISGITRVYELKEKWANVIGKVNMTIGGLSRNMGQARKVMSKWEGQVHGLTGKFGEGSAQATEYLAQLGIMDKRALNLAGTFGVKLARGYNMGGKAAADFMRAQRTMGNTNEEVAVGIGEMTALARDFDVPINVLAKDIGEASGFMLQFGKSGSKAFIQSAVHLKRFNISMKDMQKFMGAFDTLDDAVGSVSKLNIVFGTTISSMDMMLNQDPGERFELVRQQMLSQGKTYDQLGRAEMQMLTSTLKLSEDEVAAMLDQERAHMGLNDIRSKAAEKDMKEAKAKKLMQKQLQKTAQTLFSFSSAMDKVTRAIGRALAPILDSFGLGEKKGAHFGKTMGSLTDTLVRFFDGLAKSPKWIKFMHKIGDAIKDVIKWVTSLTESDFTKFFEKTIGYIQTAYKYAKIFMAVWAVNKVARIFSPIIAGLFKVRAGLKKTATEATTTGAAMKNMGAGAGGGAFAPRAGNWEDMSMGQAGRAAGSRMYNSRAGMGARLYAGGAMDRLRGSGGGMRRLGSRIAGSRMGMGAQMYASDMYNSRAGMGARKMALGARMHARNAARGIGRVGRGIGRVGGSVGRGMGRLGGRMKRGAGGMLGGAMMGSMIGGVTGGGTKGGSIGGAVGGALGSFAGPLGMAIGSAAGGLIGKEIQKMIPVIKGVEGGNYSMEQQIRSKRQIAEVEGKILTVKKAALAQDKLLASQKQIESSTLDVLMQQQGNKVVLNEQEQANLGKLAIGMNDLGIKTGLTKTQLEQFADPSKGPVSLTKRQMELLSEKSNEYYGALSDLNADALRKAGVLKLEAKINATSAVFENRQAQTKIKQERELLDLLNSNSESQKKIGKIVKDGGWAKAADAGTSRRKTKKSSKHLEN
jgi:hypothetical protein